MKNNIPLKSPGGFKEGYSKRTTKGILGSPHRKRLKDISKACGNYTNMRVIEFGMILLLKQLFRYIAYHESYFGKKENRYSLKELFYAGIFCDLERVSRVKYRHKGYDYRNTVKMLSQKFKLILKINTPFRWMPDRLSYGTILIFQKYKSIK